jgi:hypothetical protein
MTTHRPCKDLLSDDEVASWYANLNEGSELTADIYLRRLNRYCEEFDTTPQALAAMSSKDAYKLLVNAVRGFRLRGLAGSSISVYIKTLRSWFLHNDIVIAKKVRIDGAGSTPTLRNEQTPEPYVLHSVWKFCDERQAALVACLAFTGFRPHVFGNHRGSDGLKLEDLPELEVDNKEKKVKFNAIPTRITVRDKLSKTRCGYEGLLCEEGCGRLEKYLVKRMEAGQILKPLSALIADDEGTGRNVTTKSICKLVRKAFRHAGFPWRPYILRRYYDVRMGQAVPMPELGLKEEWVKFWMGRHGDIEATYRLHKKLSDSQLEQMRDAYQRASEAMLETVELHRDDRAKIRRELRVMTLSLAGFSDEEIREIDLDKSTTEQLQELMKQKLRPNRSNSGNPNDRILLTVTSEEAKDYINNKRWKFSGITTTGEIAIEPPP